MTPSHTGWYAAWLGLAFGGTLGLQGCSAVLDIPDDPRLVDAEPDAGDAGDERWACLDAPGSDEGPSLTTATVRVYACDFVTNCANPVSDLTARLCLKRDVGCTNPIQAGITDTDGLLVFDVDVSGEGFDGYLEVRAPTASCTDTEVFGEAGEGLCELLPECDPSAPDEACQAPTYAPAMLFFNPPVTADREEPMPLPLLPSAALPNIVNAAGAPLDPTTGNLFITAKGCDGKPASGVTYSISQHQEKVTQLYVDNGVVSDTSLETDESGIGGFVGVPPGFAEVTGYNEELEVIGEIGVQAAPFTLTYSDLGPF